MADSLFDFELLDSTDVILVEADSTLQAVAVAETAQLAADQDEMAILADYVIPQAKTPEDLARDLEAMVSGVNTLKHLPLLSQRNWCALHRNRPNGSHWCRGCLHRHLLDLNTGSSATLQGLDYALLHAWNWMTELMKVQL